MSVGLDCQIMRDIYTSSEVRACFESRSLVQGWLDAERALAVAESNLGVIPLDAATAIAGACDAGLYDLDDLGRGVQESRHPLVPLIRALTGLTGRFGGYVHWGATTQDIMDTGLVLQLRRGLEPIQRDLRAATTQAATLAYRYRGTPMAGRTHGQHAVPITFGIKAAGWAAELHRCCDRLSDARHHAMTAQLGGAAGTLAALGEMARPVRREYCRLLVLREPDLPWHTMRDRLRDLGHSLSEIAAAAERIASEIIRLQATEVREVSETSGDSRHVGSSTMPQKSNPMLSEYVVASARLLRGTVGTLAEAPNHAHERDMGLWAVEWIAVPQALVLAGGLVQKLAAILSELEVYPEQMMANLQSSEGELFAEAVMIELASAIGRSEAHDLVSQLSRSARESGRAFSAILFEDTTLRKHIGARRLATLTSVNEYLGLARQDAVDIARALGANDGPIPDPHSGA